eukprot:Lithocolla_globosa_v1_NODE_749_length_3335_cov_9.570427.p3 type:complete len:129 gc:universal NODE_749_length_3335_cov_9.570427:2028-2414(+)
MHLKEKSHNQDPTYHTCSHNHHPRCKNQCHTSTIRQSRNQNHFDFRRTELRLRHHIRIIPSPFLNNLDPTIHSCNHSHHPRHRNLGHMSSQKAQLVCLSETKPQRKWGCYLEFAAYFLVTHIVPKSCS